MSKPYCPRQRCRGQPQPLGEITMSEQKRLTWVFILFNTEKRIRGLDFSPQEAFDQLIAIKEGEDVFECDCHLFTRCNCGSDIQMYEDYARTETRRRIHHQEIVMPTYSSLRTAPRVIDEGRHHSVGCASRDSLDQHRGGCPNRHEYHTAEFETAFIEHTLGHLPEHLNSAQTSGGGILLSSLIN